MINGDFNEVLAQNRVFVLFIAKRLKKRLPEYIEMDCLVAAGFVGLFKAWKKYDPKKGKFKAFASRRIYGEMIDWMRTESGKKGGKGYEKKKWAVSLNLLYENLEEEEPTTLQDILVVPQSENEVESLDEIRAMLVSLSPKEREMVKRKVLEGWTLDELGEPLGVTGSRVCQIWKKIKDKLREEISPD